VEDELRKCWRRLAEAETSAEEFKSCRDLLEIAHEEKINMEKAKIVQILEAGFSEHQKLGMWAQLELAVVSPADLDPDPVAFFYIKYHSPNFHR